jgi:hypothetical protein
MQCVRSMGQWAEKPLGSQLTIRPIYTSQSCSWRLRTGAIASRSMRQSPAGGSKRSAQIRQIEDHADDLRAIIKKINRKIH